MALKPYQIEKTKRNKKILAYKNQGLSLGAIARIFHITKQRVSQLIKRPVDKK